MWGRSRMPSDSRRRRPRGQAIIETALVLPMMLFLVAAFLALMLQVELQEELTAAVKIAAESSFQAPKERFDPAGDRCCMGTAPMPVALQPSFSTGGLPTRCRFAAESFYGTMRLYSQFLDFTGSRGPFCTNDGSASFTAPAGATATAPAGDIQCDIYAQVPSLFPNTGLTGVDPYDPGKTTNYPPVVTCTSKARIDFSKTPLAWAIFWTPTISASATSLPPPFRQ